MPTLDLFSLLDEPTFTPSPLPLPKSQFPKPAPTKPPSVVSKTERVVSGWIKTYQGPPLSAESVTSLATLTRVSGDGHLYREAQFRLSDGVSIEEYPGGFGFRGLRVKGQKELISLYDGVRRELAEEIT